MAAEIRGVEVDNEYTAYNDSDHDGVLNPDEVAFGLDPANPDSDGDGATDGQELSVARQINRVGDSQQTVYVQNSDPRVADTDHDGLSDGDELAKHTDANNWDSDGDTLADGVEVHSYASDPTKLNTDGFGPDDAGEVKAGTDPGHVEHAELLSQPEFAQPAGSNPGFLSTPRLHVAEPQAAATTPTHLDPLPGSTTGAGGGFVQMFPTKVAEPAPTPDTAPDPATPAPATPPTGNGIELDVDFGGGANGGGYHVHLEGLDQTQAAELLDHLAGNQPDTGGGFGHGAGATGTPPADPAPEHLGQLGDPGDAMQLVHPLSHAASPDAEEEHAAEADHSGQAADPHPDLNGFAAQEPGHEIAGLMT